MHGDEPAEWLDGEPGGARECEPTSHGSARLQQVEAPSLAAGVLGPGGGGLCYNSLSVQGLGTTVVVSTSGEGSRRKGGKGEGGRCNRGRRSTGADIVQLQCCVAQYQAW